MEKDFKKTFSECPVCHSTNRFFEQMAQEVKDRGLAHPNWIFSYDTREGVVADQEKLKLNQVPIGSELPAYFLRTDICMDCGNVYAVELVRLNAKVGVAPPNLNPLQNPLNRSQRRMLDRNPN